MYDRLLEKNPNNAPVLKRKAAMERARGNPEAAVEQLNAYLATCVRLLCAQRVCFLPRPSVLSGNPRRRASQNCVACGARHPPGLTTDVNYLRESPTTPAAERFR